MENSVKSNRIFSQMVEWLISVLVTAIILGFGVIYWNQYSGVSGFLNDIYGILTMSIPVPFWVVVLLGVGLSISFYRERFSYRKLFSSKK